MQLKSNGRRSYDGRFPFLISERYVVQFPKHYLAAISDSGRPKYKFFDPNFGHGIFADGSDFKLFLHDFFNYNDLRLS